MSFLMTFKREHRQKSFGQHIYLVNYVIRVSNYIFAMSCGVLSPKFVDISALEHHFPNNVNTIGFAVTLLHNHRHAPPHHYLLYRNHFDIAEYLPASEAQKYTPCSWFIEEGKVLAYEFTDHPITFDPIVIKDHLTTLSGLGFDHYGTTVRPVRNCMELQTEKGHIYIPMQEFHSIMDGRISETVTNGVESDGCWIRCYEVSTGHGTFHSFD